MTLSSDLAITLQARILKPVMLTVVMLIYGACNVSAQQATAKSSTKPEAETPQERMLMLAHTDALPQFDRAEVFAISFPDRKGNEKPKNSPTEKTFPVRPYGLYADIHDQITIKGEDCDRLRELWRSLSFDRFGGAFCHFPVYGFRLYRNDELLFETTVCWECQNFYIPKWSSKNQQANYEWFGFADNEKSKALLEFFRKKLPHPRLK